VYRGANILQANKNVNKNNCRMENFESFLRDKKEIIRIDSDDAS